MLTIRPEANMINRLLGEMAPHDQQMMALSVPRQAYFVHYQREGRDSMTVGILLFLVLLGLGGIVFFTRKIEARLNKADRSSYSALKPRRSEASRETANPEPITFTSIQSDPIGSSKLEKPKRRSGPQRTLDVQVKFSVYTPRMDPAQLASFTSDAGVKSFSSETVYLVNLSKLTCTCPDFRQTRQFISPANPCRLCKHLVRFINDNWEVAKKAFPDQLIAAEIQFMNQIDHGMPNEIITAKGSFLIDDEAIEVAMKYEKSGWLNIYRLTDQGLVDRCGFSSIERRWAWGENPFPEGSKRKVNGMLLKLCKELDQHM